MKQEIDDKFLAAMGYLSNPQGKLKDKALKSILGTINLRIGQRIISRLDAAQMEQLNDLMDKDASPEELAAWTRQNVPDFERILEEETEAVKEDSSELASRVLGDLYG